MNYIKYRIDKKREMCHDEQQRIIREMLNQ